MFRLISVMIVLVMVSCTIAADKPKCNCPEKYCSCLSTGICQCEKCDCPCGCGKSGICKCRDSDKIYAAAYNKCFKTKQVLVVHVGGVCPASRDFALDTSMVHIALPSFPEAAAKSVVVGVVRNSYVEPSPRMVRMADLSWCATIDDVNAVLGAYRVPSRIRKAYIPSSGIETNWITPPWNPGVYVPPFGGNRFYRGGGCPGGVCR